MPAPALAPAQPQSQGKISLAKVSGTIYMEVRVPLKKVKSVGVTYRNNFEDSYYIVSKTIP